MIRDNFVQVMERIERAAVSAGREPRDVSLVVVTKGHPVEVVQEAIEAGAQRLGENYAEEGAGKRTSLPAGLAVEWHMIGHVQSRKARLVCENYDWVETVDGLKLAARLDRFAGELERKLPILLECNVSGEETKYGFPAANEVQWNAALTEIGKILELPNLRIGGLMTMAPFFSESDLARPYFRRLSQFRTHLSRCFPAANWSQLSMGMSNDFEAAIQEGATLVRIGQAIVGPRPTH